MYLQGNKSSYLWTNSWYAYEKWGKGQYAICNILLQIYPSPYHIFVSDVVWRPRFDGALKKAIFVDTISSTKKDGTAASACRGDMGNHHSMAPLSQSSSFLGSSLSSNTVIPSFTMIKDKHFFPELKVRCAPKSLRDFPLPNTGGTATVCFLDGWP